MADDMARVETEMAILGRRIENAARRSTTFRLMDRAAYLIARTLEEGGPASLNEIAKALSLDSSTVTRQVAAMEARGQATRKIHPDDGRAWVISVTPLGRKQMESISETRRSRFGSWLEAWSPADVASFGELLHRFNEALAGAPALNEPQAASPKRHRVEHRQSVLPSRRSR
jgi:DNA-binding MarR family transcriptional regulator